MRIKKSIFFVCLLSGVIFFSSIRSISATTSWEENFNNPPFDEWYLHSYDFTTGRWFLDSYPPIISNGLVQMSPPGDIHRMASAIHNSTVAYGTWNFDFYIANDSIISAAFICNDQGGGENYSLEGLNWADINMVSYILYITSGEATHWSLTENSILLKLFTGELLWNYGILANHQFSAPFPGHHNLEITRNSTQGEFNVYLDSEHLFSITDNEITSSLVFEFCTFLGNASFDNLTVIDSNSDSSTSTTTAVTTTTTTSTLHQTTDDPTTTSIPTNGTTGIQLGVFLFTMIICIIFKRKRKL